MVSCLADDMIIVKTFLQTIPVTKNVAVLPGKHGYVTLWLNETDGLIVALDAGLIWCFSKLMQSQSSTLILLSRSYDKESGVRAVTIRQRS